MFPINKNRGRVVDDCFHFRCNNKSLPSVRLLCSTPFSCSFKDAPGDSPRQVVVLSDDESHASSTSDSQLNCNGTLSTYQSHPDSNSTSDSLPPRVPMTHYDYSCSSDDLWLSIHHQLLLRQANSSCLLSDFLSPLCHPLCSSTEEVELRTKQLRNKRKHMPLELPEAPKMQKQSSIHVRSTKTCYRPSRHQFMVQPRISCSTKLLVARMASSSSHTPPTAASCPLLDHFTHEPCITLTHYIHPSPVRDKENTKFHFDNEKITTEEKDTIETALILSTLSSGTDR